MLPEFDHEMANTRECLSRIPADKLDWQAHEKSYDLRGLATHIANMPKWTVMTLEESSFDMEPEGEEPITERSGRVRRRRSRDVRCQCCGRTRGHRQRQRRDDDGDLVTAQGWRRSPDNCRESAVLRSFIMNHMIHHRAQLTVYLRLNDVPVPALYGPSADETS